MTLVVVVVVISNFAIVVIFAVFINLLVEEAGAKLETKELRLCKMFE